MTTSSEPYSLNRLFQDVPDADSTMGRTGMTRPIQAPQAFANITLDVQEPASAGAVKTIMFLVRVR